MKKAAVGLFLAVMMLVSASGLWATPAEDEDFSYWSQNDIEVKLSSKWKVKAGEELRFREHAGITYYDTHAGTVYQASPYLSLGADYLQVRQTRSRGRKDIWYWEERPRFYVTPRLVFHEFTLEDRNMLEIRFRQGIEDSVRYRNLATLTAPWKWTSREIQPYIADEIFIDSSRNGVTENRLYTGLKFRIWKNVYGSLFYLRQSSKNNSAQWKDLNILGTGLKLSL